MGPIFFWGEDQTISNSMVKFWGSSFPYCWRWKWYPHVFFGIWYHPYMVYLPTWMVDVHGSFHHKPTISQRIHDLLSTEDTPKSHLKVWMVQMILSLRDSALFEKVQTWVLFFKFCWEGERWMNFLPIFLKWGTLTSGECHFGECPLGIFWGRQWTNARHDFFEDLQNGMTHPICSSVEPPFFFIGVLQVVNPCARCDQGNP